MGSGATGAPFEDAKRLGKSHTGCRRSIWMNCRHISASLEWHRGKYVK
jgi:hypothetical protein